MLVVGDFNVWDGCCYLMWLWWLLGVWELFVLGIGVGECYKYELCVVDGCVLLYKVDLCVWVIEVLLCMVLVVVDVVVFYVFVWYDDGWMYVWLCVDCYCVLWLIYEVYLELW